MFGKYGMLAMSILSLVMSVLAIVIAVQSG